MKRTSIARGLLTTCGIFILFYCVFILGYVGTSPDVGLRFLLVDSDPKDGPVITAVTDTLKHKGADPPASGDILLGMGPAEKSSEMFRITTFVHFTQALGNLRYDPPIGGDLHPGADVAELDSTGIPPFVEIAASESQGRQRWVQIAFRRPNETEIRKTWLEVHSFPLSSTLLSFVWFLLQLNVFAVGALACWIRPHDRAARLFFAMCIVASGAFVGGYHWWVIASNFAVNIPFCLCALLLPVVTLHFFLIFPHPKPPMVRAPRAALVGMYLLPLIAACGILGWLGQAWWQFSQDLQEGITPARAELILIALANVRLWITGYLGVAATCFAGTLFSLAYSFYTTRNPLEHSQVKWILWAAVGSSLPVAYTIYLAQFHRVEFAIGEGSLPMFVASLLFMLAYANGMLRHKLMLVDQLLSREVLYFAVSAVATGLYSLMVAIGCLLGVSQTLRTSRDTVVVAATLMAGVLLLAGLRDRIQRMIDRRFFREKYKLDQALQRLQHSAGKREPEAVSKRLVASCLEALGVDRAALFLREEEGEEFRLAAADPATPDLFPIQVQAEEGLLKILQATNSVQRVVSGQGHPSTQGLLRRLDARLVHALQVDGTIIGLVALGAKRDAGPYTAEDVTFLTAMGQVAGVALQSAKVHQAVARLNEELGNKVNKIAEQQRQIAVLQTELTSRISPRPVTEREAFRRDDIKGSSVAIRTVLETVRKVSDSQATVLIRGESGTGKELLARALHDNSPRKAGPMIRVNCAALAPGLLESELFGHVKGSFTGAHKDKIGRFEMADGGTLFLDEIGDISLETQVKLLRVLQERSFEPVGGTRTVQVDVRLITATHQSLETLITEGRFREDLFYRLNVISITLPALRERREDLFELSLHFLARAGERIGKQILQLDDSALEALERYHWPGNIRELENVIERAVVLADGDRVMVDDLPDEVLATLRGPGPSIVAKPANRLPPSAPVNRLPAPESPEIVDAGVNGAERSQLLDALRRAAGNKAQAARLLGLPRSTFFSKLRKYRIES